MMIWQDSRDARLFRIFLWHKKNISSKGSLRPLMLNIIVNNIIMLIVRYLSICLWNQVNLFNVGLMALVLLLSVFVNHFNFIVSAIHGRRLQGFEWPAIDDLISPGLLLQNSQFNSHQILLQFFLLMLQPRRYFLDHGLARIGLKKDQNGYWVANLFINGIFLLYYLFFIWLRPNDAINTI